MLAAWFMRHTSPNGVRRVAQLNGAVATDVGSVREDNQDRVALVRGRDRSGGCFIVAALADGIGGMKQGAECAALTLGTFIDSVVADAQLSTEPGDWLASGAHRANRAVHAKLAGEGGSTLVAALLMNGRPPHWLSIGDSRAYQAYNGKLHQLSLDDTIDGQLGKSGGGRRRDLLQFVGIGDVLEPHIEPIVSASGSMLLTSDGVHFIEADYLAKVVYYAPDLGFCVRRLTELAKMLGGPDNATVAALSLDALAVNAETHLHGVYEVWDPFGELQIMFDCGPRQYVATSPQQASAADTPKHVYAAPLPPVVSPGNETKPANSRQEEPTDEGSATKNMAHQKKPRSSRKKPKQSPADPGEHRDADEPQLFIEFPNKKP